MVGVFRVRFTSPLRFATSLIALWLLQPPAASAEAGAELAERVATTLEQAGGVRGNRVQGEGYRWITIELRDETYPLRVDIVGSRSADARKLMFMLPGGSTNFEGSFFTPHARNITHFMGEHGYLVIGISPREDGLPAALTNYRFTESWGLAKHSADVRSVIARVVPALGLAYDVLGHSYGATTALDYAARYSNLDALERLLVVDIYSLDVAADPVNRENAARTYRAHVELMQDGEFVDRTYALTKPAARLARQTPMLDSGQSRARYGKRGNFTMEGLLFATIVDGAGAEGIHTSITGLPGDFLQVKSMVAGRYVPADDPRSDRYALARTRLDTFLATVEVAGSGLIAVALERDIWALTAADPAYTIDWSAIRAEVLWVNGELSYGPHRYAAQLIRDAGNPRVRDWAVPGYAHGDVLWGETARRDLWEKLLP